MKRATLGEIAAAVGGKLIGEAKIEITGVAGLRNAVAGDLTVLSLPRLRDLVGATKASAIIAPPDLAEAPCAIVQAGNPEYAFIKAYEFLRGREEGPVGVDPRAAVAEDARLGRGVYVGPFAIVEARASVGDGARIFGGCYVGRDCVVGNSCTLYPGVVLMDRVRIGDRAILHSGVVLGADGFGFVTHEGAHHKVPQLGTVEIGSDVELGACVTIDRARFDVTRVADGTKIDNLVHLGHNVIMGEGCLVAAQTGFSGSVEVGARSVFGGQVGVSGHLAIGPGSVLSGKSGVTRDLAGGRRYSGFPAKEHEKEVRQLGALKRLPALEKRVKELEDRLADLEAQSEDDKKSG